jgi:hypothetical protein
MSIDINGKAELLKFCKFFANGNITEEFKFYKPVPEITKRRYIIFCLAANSEAPVSIPGATRFYE